LELEAPTHADIAEVAARTAARVEKILRAYGRSLDPALADETPPELAVDEPTLAVLYGAAAQGIGVSGDRAGLPPLRLITAPPDRPQARDVTDAPIAEVRGINVHAAQVVDGRDRRRVERLCRYITRPSVAQERLQQRSDGKLELTFKKPWRDGTRALVLEPDDLIARLVAAVPPPRFHTLRYFDKPPTRKRWAWLLAHIFAADVETCPRCAGPMRWAEVATSQADITRLLADNGLGPRAPPLQLRRHRVPEQLSLGFREV
jgi:hypothetical protein